MRPRAAFAALLLLSACDGLPFSLQLVGKPLAEPLLCRLGYAYEQATTWHTMRPPVS